MRDAVVPSKDAHAGDSDTMMEDLFLYIAPLNLILAIIVLILNTTIQRDYYRDRKLPATFLFMIIAAADVLFATADIYRSSVAILCTQRPNKTFPSWFTMGYIIVGFWSYNFSIFANVVLSVVKTINLSAPFYQLEKVAIALSVAVAGVFWAGLSITDGMIYSDNQEYETFGCKEQWSILENYDFVGSGLVLEVDNADVLFTKKMLAVVQYLVPSLIVLICMVVQMSAITNTIADKNTASQVNMTVFLVSALYFICNSAYGVFFLSEYTLNRKKTLSIEFLMKYTLPLLNAAFFPIILIWRKASLRVTYRAFWTSFLGMPRRLLRRRAFKKRKDGKNYNSVATADPNDNVN